ncbi:TPA: restriction endonuclease subunit S [Escherichia coli]|nr:restriction endonuclease subunit S [Escherichia coli]EJQ7974113.1 restriction endonuclease subunit S [Escherichia coli]HBN2116409.1 restriction endonuclease subunit S [Escherichia coli]HBN2117647.1 restriction endonuclease subunit S [Escherichia coli]HDP6594857.1 restriction endonuclease subunit S [Escherichia coli]
MMVPKLRFKNFEGIWEPKSLKDIACLTSSKRVHLSDYVKEGIPFFRGKEITELKSGIIPSDILYISPLLFNEFKVKYGTPKAGEILITAVGTLGNIYHINNIGDFYFKDGNLIWLKELKCNSLFLSFLLTFKKNEILNSAIGSTQKALTMVELNKLVFNYPRNDEQVKIASFLSLLEEKITLLNKQYNLLCQYKKGMMQKIFSQEVRFKDECGENFSDWNEILLGKVGEIITGKTPSTSITEYWNGDILFTTPTDMNDSIKYLTETERKVTSKGIKRVLPEGTIMFTCIASIGKMALSKLPCITNQQINSIIVNEKYNNEFIYYHLQYIKPKIIASQANTTVPIVNKSDFSAISLQIPNLAEQTKIANFLSALDDKIAAKKTELDKLKAWKQGLLQQMFI